MGNSVEADEAAAMLGDPVPLAKRRFAEIADDLGVSFEQLKTAAENHITYGEYFIHPEDGGRFEGESLPDDFWDIYEAMTQIKTELTGHSRGSFLSCSC